MQAHSREGLGGSEQGPCHGLGIRWRSLGIDDLDGICAVLLALEPRHFYKSMTTHADHRIWQDVYHASTQAGDDVYIKLTVIEDVLIVSFKEL